MARRKHSPTSINFVPLRIVVILVVLVALGVGSMCGSGNKEQAAGEEQMPATETQQAAQEVLAAGTIEQPAAFRAICTIIPVAMMVTSEPSFRVVPLPSSKE